MPFGVPPVHGALPLIPRSRLAFTAIAALLFSGSGCIVTQTTYEMKTKEADSLREAMASLNREKAKLAEGNEALSKQVTAGKETEASLSARLKERDDSVKHLSDEIATARQSYEGTRTTREQFINELLEKEKATGKRLQDLAARAEGCERDQERMKAETAARDQELSGLRKQLEAALPASEAARRERDILSGRVERLQEERRESDKRRDDILAGLAADLEKLSPEVSVFPMGPAIRIVVPERLALKDRGGKLTELGSAMVSRVAGAAAGIPSASLVVIAGGKASVETLRGAAAGGKIPEGRLFPHVREKDRQAELLLIAP